MGNNKLKFISLEKGYYQDLIYKYTFIRDK